MSNNTRNIPIPMERLAAPAQRALTGAGYTTLEQLAKTSEAKVRELHGIGPNALKVLHAALAANGMSFAKDGYIKWTIEVAYQVKDDPMLDQTAGWIGSTGMTNSASFPKNRGFTFAYPSMISGSMLAEIVKSTSFPINFGFSP